MSGGKVAGKPWEVLYRDNKDESSVRPFREPLKSSDSTDISGISSALSPMIGLMLAGLSMVTKRREIVRSSAIALLGFR